MLVAPTRAASDSADRYAERSRASSHCHRTRPAPRRGSPSPREARSQASSWPPRWGRAPPPGTPPSSGRRLPPEDGSAHPGPGSQGRVRRVHDRVDVLIDDVPGHHNDTLRRTAGHSSNLPTGGPWVVRPDGYVRGRGGAMATVRFAEGRIAAVEGFVVHFRYEGPARMKGKDVRGDRTNVPSYPYRRAAPGETTVAGGAPLPGGVPGLRRRCSTVRRSGQRPDAPEDGPLQLP